MTPTPLTREEYRENMLVTLHQPSGFTCDGRLTLGLASGPAVVDLHRTSLADNGNRPITPESIVHPAYAARCDCLKTPGGTTP